jgi:hypothetical protein
MIGRGVRDGLERRWCCIISGEKGILSLDRFTMRAGNIFTVTLGDVLN